MNWAPRLGGGAGGGRRVGPDQGGGARHQPLRSRGAVAPRATAWRHHSPPSPPGTCLLPSQQHSPLYTHTHHRTRTQLLTDHQIQRYGEGLQGVGSHNKYSPMTRPTLMHVGISLVYCVVSCLVGAGLRGSWSMELPARRSFRTAPARSVPLSRNYELSPPHARLDLIAMRARTYAGPRTKRGSRAYACGRRPLP